MLSLDPVICQAKCWQPPFCFSKGGTKAQICALSLAQNMLTSHVPKLTLAIAKGAHAEHQCRVCMRYTQQWGCPLARWANLWARCPQWLKYGLLGGIYEAVSRICFPLMPSKSPICCSASLFPPSSHTHDSVLWMGQKRNEPLWKHAAQLAKPSDHSHALTLPCGRNNRARSLLALSCAALWNGWCG